MKKPWCLITRRVSSKRQGIISGVIASIPSGGMLAISSGTIPFKMQPTDLAWDECQVEGSSNAFGDTAIEAKASKGSLGQFFKFDKSKAASLV